MADRATPSTAAEPEAPAARNRPLLLGLAALVLVSAAIAGVVIFSSGGAPKSPAEPVAQVRLSEATLLVGDSDAPRKVEVRERFGDARSRAFDLASRDFLRVEAAQGKVLVTYRPQAGPGEYAEEAMRDWSAAVETGNPEKAMALHARLFDDQPTGQEGATPDGEGLVVLLDGQQVQGTDGTDLADRLQRLLLEG